MCVWQQCFRHHGKHEHFRGTRNLERIITWRSEHVELEYPHITCHMKSHKLGWNSDIFLGSASGVSTCRLKTYAKSRELCGLREKASVCERLLVLAMMYMSMEPQEMACIPFPANFLATASDSSPLHAICVILLNPCSFKHSTCVSNLARPKQYILLRVTSVGTRESNLPRGGFWFKSHTSQLDTLLAPRCSFASHSSRYIRKASQTNLEQNTPRSSPSLNHMLPRSSET